MRFPENLQRFALCGTLCYNDVALRCTETPRFLLHRCPLQGLVLARGTLSNARHPVGAQPLGKGLYATPFLGMETRHGFGAARWVFPGTGELSSFIMTKHTHGGSESSNRSVSSVICTAFNLGQALLCPCSVTAARDGNFGFSEYIFGAFRGTVFLAPKYGASFWPLYMWMKKGFLLVGCSWYHFGGPFSAPRLLQFFQFWNPMLVSVNAAAPHGHS